MCLIRSIIIRQSKSTRWIFPWIHWNMCTKTCTLFPITCREFPITRAGPRSDCNFSTSFRSLKIILVPVRLTLVGCNQVYQNENKKSPNVFDLEQRVYMYVVKHNCDWTSCSESPITTGIDQYLIVFLIRTYGEKKELIIYNHWFCQAKIFNVLFGIKAAKFYNFIHINDSRNCLIKNNVSLQIDSF